MNTKELSEFLSKHSDIDKVWVVTDHGQDPEELWSVSVEYVHESCGEVSVIHEDDLGEFEEGELVHGIVLWG